MTIIIALFALLGIINPAQAGSCHEVCAHYDRGRCVQMRVIYTDHVHRTGGWYPCPDPRSRLPMRAPRSYVGPPPDICDPYGPYDQYSYGPPPDQGWHDQYGSGQYPPAPPRLYGQTARIDESQAAHDARVVWEQEQRLEVQTSQTQLAGEQARSQALETQMRSTTAQRDAAIKAAARAKLQAQRERERAESAEQILLMEGEPAPAPTPAPSEEE